MSLGDQLRYLRALHGGGSFEDLQATLGHDTLVMLRQVEQRYREVSDVAFVDRLAAYYGIPAEELHWHRARSRKALALHVHAAMQSRQPITLRLRNGETLTGTPAWWDLAAIGLQPLDGGSLIVVQRHAVIDWDGAAQ